MKIFTTGSTGHLTQEIFVNAKLSRDQHALAKFIFLGNPDDTVPPNPNCINFNSRCASDLSRFPWFDRPGVIIAVGQQDNDLTFGLGSPQSIDSQRQAITDGSRHIFLKGLGIDHTPLAISHCFRNFESTNDIHQGTVIERQRALAIGKPAKGHDSDLIIATAGKSAAARTKHKFTDDMLHRFQSADIFFV